MFRTHFKSVTSAAALFLAATCGWAQPTNFADLGSITAAATPSSALEYVSLPPAFLDPGFAGPGQLLTVAWARFDLSAPIDGDLFLDIDSRITSISSTPGDLFMALYDNAGNLVAADDTDGSFPELFAAGLSFGSSGFRTPPNTPVLAGQDGATLPAGRYWLALAAGNAFTVTANPTGWDITTTSSYQLGFLFDGTSYVELSITTGNTTPLPPPSNDNCTSPLAIGENTNADTPVWTGSNAGATSDGLVPCYGYVFPANAPKDIWFQYTASSTGFAEVVATGGAGGGGTPLLARYTDCFTTPVQCTGGSFFSFGEAVRLSFPVVAGEYYLLGLSIRAGDTGPMELNIRTLPSPVPLDIPAGAISESELSCGDSSNDGCNVSPPAYDQLAIGQTVRGTLFNNATIRDTDWFEFNLTQPSNVTLTFSAQFPSGAAILGERFAPTACLAPEALTVINDRYAGLSETYSGSIELPAGTHRAVIANAFFDGIGCGTGYEQYWLRIDATPITPPCLPDLVGGISGGGDGVVDGSDFIAFINSFSVGNPATDPLADIAGGGGTGPGPSPDGIIDGSDFIAFINAFAAGC